MAKRKKSSSSKLPKGYVEISFYGIWNKKTKKIVFVSIDRESSDVEFDLEGYDEDFILVYLKTIIDIKSLEP